MGSVWQKKFAFELDFFFMYITPEKLKSFLFKFWYEFLHVQIVKFGSAREPQKSKG
jgi:hypothetical protein